MDKKQKFVDKLKGAPHKAAQAIDDYAKRVRNHPEFNREYLQYDDEKYYSASFELPIKLTRKLDEREHEELADTFSNATVFDVDDNESYPGDLSVSICLRADLAAFSTVAEYVAQMAEALDFVENKDKHIAEIMNNPTVIKEMDWYGVEKL